MKTRLPSRSSPNDGEDGGYGAKVASRAIGRVDYAPANTVATRSADVRVAAAIAIPGRALPAAHPQTEFTTIW